ncbi:MAG TPA: DUF2470 domain-containing protein [Pseudolabrys sp.]|nr:DUF2470 domain-containing protein [Pseudolabrys sp.]
MKPHPDFDPRQAGKKLLHEGRSGALATLMAGSGDPYCSLVNVATDIDGAPLLLLSLLALHTKNILADPRISLMLDERKEGDPLEGARIMLMGHAAVSADANVRRRYLARHPDAAQYAGFGDFAFYKMTIARAHLVAGFGRIVDLAPGDVLADTSDARTLTEAEAEAIAHMNADHAEALRLYATRLLGAPNGEWRCVAFNPEGIELQCGRDALWLPFPARVVTPMALRQMLKDLATHARAQ